MFQFDRIEIDIVLYLLCLVFIVFPEWHAVFCLLQILMHTKEMVQRVSHDWCMLQ